jgi:hypothetical protein
MYSGGRWFLLDARIAGMGCLGSRNHVNVRVPELGQSYDRSWQHPSSKPLGFWNAATVPRIET